MTLHCFDKDHGGLKACVFKQFLNDSDSVVGMQEVGYEGVAKGVVSAKKRIRRRDAVNRFAFDKDKRSVYSAV